MQSLSLSKLTSIAFFCLLSLLSFTTSAQVGINTTSPTTTLDVNGALSIRESPMPLALNNGANIDVVLPGAETHSVYRIVSPTGAFFIDGIKNVGVLADGQIVRLINTTNQLMTIVHDNGISFPSLFKIVCPSETNLLLPGKNSSVTLQYNKSLSKWTVAGYAISSNTNAPSTTKYSVFARNVIAKNNAIPQNMGGMIITFTPANSIVYVTYGVYGDINPGSTEGRFHLLLNDSPVFNTEIRTGDLPRYSPYRAMLPMFPLSVTPGTPVNLKVQWWTEGGGTINNNPAQYPSHGRYITIID